MALVRFETVVRFSSFTPMLMSAFDMARIILTLRGVLGIEFAKTGMESLIEGSMLRKEL